MDELVVNDGVCRVCGYTDDWGCDGGCFWVASDLCSSCAGEADEEGAA